MIFEKILENEDIVKPSTDTSFTISKLEPERELGLKRIMKAYSIKRKGISKTKLLKIAIDNLIKNLEDLPEEEAIEYIRRLYKEAEF